MMFSPVILTKAIVTTHRLKEKLYRRKFAVKEVSLCFLWRTVFHISFKSHALSWVGKYYLKLFLAR